MEAASLQISCQYARETAQVAVVSLALFPDRYYCASGRFSIIVRLIGDEESNFIFQKIYIRLKYHGHLMLWNLSGLVDVASQCPNVPYLVVLFNRECCGERYYSFKFVLFNECERFVHFAFTVTRIMRSIWVISNDDEEYFTVQLYWYISVLW